MSWFSAVTGKAEDFLNKLDKSAAGVLHTENENEPTVPAVNVPFITQHDDSVKSLSPSQSVPSSLYSLKDTEKKSHPSSSGSVKDTSKYRENVPQSKSIPSQSSAKSKKDSDEALFDFLNSKDSTEKGKKRQTPLSSRHHSRQSSTSSIVSSSSKGPKIESSVAAPLETAPKISSDVGAKGGVEEDAQQLDDSPTTSHVSADMDILADAMKESPPGSDQSAPDDSEQADGGTTDVKDRKLSSLELENRLLRNEVTSLNQEMITALKRAKDSEAEISRVKEKLNAHSNSATMQDQLVRELQSRETDLTEALSAKDSQLAVLRVRLEEADKRISIKEKSLEEVKLERERILKDHSDSSGMHGQALDAMKLKLEEVESSLKREQDAYKQAQREAEERQSRLQEEQQTMTDELRNSEKMLSEEKFKATDLGNQLKVAKASAESSKKELSDYKDKAARILQSKERLINSLREGSGSLTDSGVSIIEYEALRQEKDMQKEELQQTKLTVENLRQELQDMENQLQQENDTAQDMIRSLEDTAREEKRRREDAEQEILKLKQELQYALDELHKQKSAFQSRMNDREADIEKLRNQLMTKSMSSNSETELESRVRSLTESLIQKQTILEALSTEKNSLVLQLERMEQQHRDLENAIPRPAASQFVATNDHDDDVRQRLPLFLREVPSDHEVTRRVKRAASSIDKFSIRLGVFLRRYPIARVFVIVYMALLHLWVLIVMVTYQPEMHGSEFQPEPPKD